MSGQKEFRDRLEAALGSKEVREQPAPGNQDKGQPDAVVWEAAAQSGCLGPRK